MENGGVEGRGPGEGRGGPLLPTVTPAAQVIPKCPTSVSPAFLTLSGHSHLSY